MDDAISRQAVLKLLSTMPPEEAMTKTLLIQSVKQMSAAQPEEVTPHRNYQYLSDYWCECGWHLGKMGDVNYCPNCGKKVKWDG